MIMRIICLDKHASVCGPICEIIQENIDVSNNSHSARKKHIINACWAGVWGITTPYIEREATLSGTMVQCQYNPLNAEEAYMFHTRRETLYILD